MAFTSGGSLIGLSLVLTDLVAFDSAITILQLNLATSLSRSDEEFIEGCVTLVNSAKELLNVSQFVICVVCSDWPMIRYIITVIGVFCGDDKVNY
ncbi:hypothetical protein BpHYR1_014614 [Brachionus plicatilis]|uniref:Uncharacterized protein n=1 Tax=Brachionus plicatilis TaxID=10195 RepID=A0A3M7QIJ2_BRAPC|nr:hypothetical protein BpHYR1_014614 [Brachionus plicatilis]